MKPAILSTILAVILVSGAIVLSVGTDASDAQTTITTATVVDDTQTIEIKAKGGYSPRAITAKAGVPTVLKVKTNGTFDCSAALAIPDLNYRKNLPPSGTTDITIPAQKSGSTLEGSCAMGMYSFFITFI